MILTIIEHLVVHASFEQIVTVGVAYNAIVLTGLWYFTSRA